MWWTWTLPLTTSAALLMWHPSLGGGLSAFTHTPVSLLQCLDLLGQTKLIFMLLSQFGRLKVLYPVISKQVLMVKHHDQKKYIFFCLHSGCIGSPPPPLSLSSHWLVHVSTFAIVLQLGNVLWIWLAWQLPSKQSLCQWSCEVWRKLTAISSIEGIMPVWCYNASLVSLKSVGNFWQLGEVLWRLLHSPCARRVYCM
jgi:hypothetical protein